DGSGSRLWSRGRRGGVDHLPVHDGRLQPGHRRPARPLLRPPGAARAWQSDTDREVVLPAPVTRRLDRISPAAPTWPPPGYPRCPASLAAAGPIRPQPRLGVVELRAGSGCRPGRPSPGAGGVPMAAAIYEDLAQRLPQAFAGGLRGARATLARR